MSLLETFSIPVGLILCKLLAGNIFKPINFLFFMGYVSMYTIVIMFYKCQIQSPETPSPKDDKIKGKPVPDYTKFWKAVFPVFIWGMISVILPYLIKFNFPPQILGILLLVSSTIGLYVVGLVGYNSALRFTAIPECYPSLLDGFLGIF